MANLRTAIAALVLCIVGPGFLALSIRNELRARALADHGVIVNADVSSISVDRATDAGERLAYRFEVDGHGFEGTSGHLARADLDVARSLGLVEVRYLPEDPSVSAPTRAATGRTQIVAFVLSGTLTLSGIAVALSLVSTKRRAAR